ncbi:hypothetical protein [Teredinibacter sp. KSP-S5-2]|uniref:hypothetical protein n=1 Tax=Teredinibacter sp. KSP-S5-2 TaxID=3034506 RepID=UPI002934C523|nr:hypothetical protein [Teredinibacter sp. KSP-S5-2]WNO10618.1 hypothetical protein P5V12_05465 [Teredinibacter sp. KSP-S5-2]
MFSFPNNEKQLKATISRYKSSLKREKKTYGHYNDGTGKRYLLFYLYLVLNDLPKFEEYMEWYSNVFSEDGGEPIQKLCWSLGLYRLGKSEAAKHKLADLMLSNLYFIPLLLGREIKDLDMWHASSDARRDYFSYIPDEILGAITDEEVSWLGDLYDSFLFRRMRKRYIEIYCQLQNTRDQSERRELVMEAYSLLDYLKEKKEGRDT